MGKITDWIERDMARQKADLERIELGLNAMRLQVLQENRLIGDLWCWCTSWARYHVYMALPWRVALSFNPFVMWLLEGAGIAFCGTWSEYRALRRADYNTKDSAHDK